MFFKKKISQCFFKILKFPLNLHYFFQFFSQQKLSTQKKFEMKKHVCWGGGEG